MSKSTVLATKFFTVQDTQLGELNKVVRGISDGFGALPVADTPKRALSMVKDDWKDKVTVVRIVFEVPQNG